MGNKNSSENSSEFLNNIKYNNMNEKRNYTNTDTEFASTSEIFRGGQRKMKVDEFDFLNTEEPSMYKSRQKHSDSFDFLDSETDSTGSEELSQFLKQSKQKEPISQPFNQFIGGFVDTSNNLFSATSDDMTLEFEGGALRRKYSATSDDVNLNELRHKQTEDVNLELEGGALRRRHSEEQSDHEIDEIMNMANKYLNNEVIHGGKADSDEESDDESEESEDDEDSEDSDETDSDDSEDSESSKSSKKSSRMRYSLNSESIAEPSSAKKNQKSVVQQYKTMMMSDGSDTPYIRESDTVNTSSINLVSFERKK